MRFNILHLVKAWFCLLFLLTSSIYYDKNLMPRDGILLKNMPNTPKSRAYVDIKNIITIIDTTDKSKRKKPKYIEVN